MLAFDQAGNQVAACRMTLGLGQAAETVPDQPLPLTHRRGRASGRLWPAAFGGNLKSALIVRVYSGAWASRTIKNSRLTQCKGS
jgi:hypothetical protein